MSADDILDRARAAAQECGLDALVLTSPENVAYVSGAAPPSQRTVRSRIAAALIPCSGPTALVAVALEEDVVRAQSRLDQLTLYREFEQHPVDVVADRLRHLDVADGRIGTEEAYMSVAERRRLKGALPRASLTAVDDLLSTLRQIKTPAEVARIREIGRAAQRIARDSLADAGAGTTERELAHAIQEAYGAAGGDHLTMLVVGSGPRSAAVNAPPTNRALEPGDIVRIDIIGTKGNYYSDVARTAVVGAPTGEQQRVYDLLSEVHHSMLSELAPGVSTSDVYGRYRAAMEAAGLPPYHFVGHGLGISLHEEPFCRAQGSITLQPGMVLCIEPLTLLDGRFGIQLEDEVLITDTGCELITEDTGLLRI